MKRYLIKSKKANDILIGYNKNSLLVYLDIKEGVSSEQIKWLLGNLPPTLEGFSKLKAQIQRKGAKVVEVQEDLSFTAFWNAYGYKKGKKDRVKRIWDTMDKYERSKALAYVKVYKFFLAQHPHVQQQYPETYLNTKEWNN